MGTAYDQYGNPYPTDDSDDSDDMTGGGSYLPSLPQMYQSIFGKLGIGTQPKTQPSIQQQYMQNYLSRGPVHNDLTNLDYIRSYGANPMRSQVTPTAPDAQSTGNILLGVPFDIPTGFLSDIPASVHHSRSYGKKPMRSQVIPPRIDTRTATGTGVGPYDSGQYPSAPTPPTAPYYPPVSRPVSYYPPGADLNPPVFIGKNQQGEPASATPTDQQQAGMMSRGLPDTYGMMDRGLPDTYGMMGRGQPTTAAPKVRTGKTQPQMPEQTADTDLPAQKSASDEFLNNDPEDMRPGSLGEAKKLFPGRPLQQAIYYTDPRSGNSQRLGVGADTSKLDPDNIARIWEPADMSMGEKAIRGAFETPGKHPITWSPEKASGGSVDHADKIAKEKSTPCHVGLITMAVGGRTDHIPMNVLEGSYVLPADIVSGLGEGNTLAGSRMIDTMFKSGPFGVSSSAPKFASLNAPRPLVPGSINSQFGFPTQSMFGTPAQNQQYADGGQVMSGRFRPVPIVAAGGEYVVHPDVVRRLGNGDMEKGHDYLDNFVKGVRKHLVKTLSKLPGPRRD
jgi:hypothetical protein